jgi:hypothetical protein
MGGRRRPTDQDPFDIVLGKEANERAEIGHRLARWPAR